MSKTTKTVRKGFTLIELLIVVVIIGILAAIAVPKFADTKEKAYLTSMKADLKNMVSGAEGWFSDNGTYVGYTAPAGSKGNTLTFTGTATGWSAQATNASTTKKCTIAVGSAVVSPAVEGAPSCS